MVLWLPSKNVYRNFIAYCSEHRDESIFHIFNQEDPHDKTTVFDFVNDVWIDYTYSNIEKVIRSELYVGDGTLEYRISYICVELNLLHKLPNGNKRTSIFILWILLLLSIDAPNAAKVLNAIESDYIYKTARNIARRGTLGREKSIHELTEYLQAIAKR